MHFVTQTEAQMVGPFIEGEGITSVPSAVRCADHKTMYGIMKQKDMHMLITGTTDNVYKSVMYNDAGDVMMVNIFPNDKACITDTMAQAFFDKKIPLKAPTEESNQ